MIRLLLDQGLPRSTAEILRRKGWDVVHVGDIDMASAADEAILARADTENRVCVTLDSDFHAILAVNRLERPSVIRFRIEHLRGDLLAEGLVEVIEKVGDALQAGAMVSVTVSAIRVHRLKQSV